MNGPEGAPGLGTQGLEAPPPLPLAPGREAAPSAPRMPEVPPARRGSWLLRLGVLVFLLLAGAMAFGGWQHYSRHLQVMATAEHQANFVPGVRVEAVTQQRRPVAVSLRRRRSPSRPRSMPGPAAMC